uniref:Putative secreted protein n=1 Tax=Ixodes scapularis TaxID=6945 RepID=A0A4D5RFI8_IXOSC
MGNLHGQLRQRRGLLPLLLLGGARLRPHHPSRHLRPRLPTNCRGPDVRNPSASEEDQAHEHCTNVVPEINI